MSTESIYSSFQPVQAYYDLLRAAFGELPPMALRVRALDVHLLHRVAATYTPPLTIVDMTGDATLGALRYFWAANQVHTHRIIGARAPWQQAAPGWRAWLASALQPANSGAEPDLSWAAGPDLIMGSTAEPLQGADLWPRLIIVTDLGDTGLAVREHLLDIVNANPAAAIAVLPVGKAGASPILDGLVLLLQAQATHRLLLAREISPFFGESELAFIFPKANQQILQTVDRLAALYDGNFSYAALLEQNYKLFQQLQSAQTQTVQLTPGPATPVSPVAPRTGTEVQSIPSDFRRQIRAALIAIARRLLGRVHQPMRASYIQASLPKEMKAGGAYEGGVQIKNDGPEAWATPPNTTNGFSASYHWTTPDGEVLVKEGIRTLLPTRVEPGQVINVGLNIAAPHAPGGYVLELDIVQEGVTWFSDAGCPGPRFAVNVLP